MNSYFAGWSGACSGTGACKVIINGDKSVSAAFGLKGDLDSSGSVDLADAVIALKVISGITCNYP